MENQTVEQALDKRRQLDELGEKIMALPEAQRWAAIKKLLFQIHPDFIEPDRLHCEAVAEIRNFVQHNEFGSSRKNEKVGNGGFRHLFKIPTYVWHALKADKEFDRLQNSSDEADIKTLHKALWDAFPEYRACRSY